MVKRSYLCCTVERCLEHFKEYMDRFNNIVPTGLAKHCPAIETFCSDAFVSDMSNLESCYTGLSSIDSRNFLHSHYCLRVHWANGTTVLKPIPNLAALQF